MNYTQEEIMKLRDQLIARRKELLTIRNHLKETWNTHREQHVELGETAQKSTMWLGMDHLDRQERDEVEAIDRALAKMDDGRYGFCEECGRNIDIRRLKILPSTAICKRCAKRQEARAKGIYFYEDSVDVEEDEDESQNHGMSDEELRTTVVEEVVNDGRIEMDGLQVSCDEGVVYLDGLVHSEIEHQILIEIVEDSMGLKDVVYNVKIRDVVEQEDDESETLQEES